MSLDAHEVYCVRVDGSSAAMIGLDVKVRDDYLTWFDTHRDHGTAIRAQRDEGDAVVVETSAGQVFRFAPLTKELYDREVRGTVELSPEFSDTASLKAFYRETFLGTTTQEP